MNERTRYRISGSVFLLALAVIVLPMLFDGAGVSAPEIPPLPEAPQAQLGVSDYDEIVPVTDVAERVSALESELDVQGFDKQTQTLVGEPALLPPDAETRTWAVQAASFAHAENARQFRSDLRAAGYEAFISTAKDDAQEVVFRVAVGPLLDRADAEVLVRDIGAAFEIQPQIQEMQP